ncbi:MAG TPA: AMP-binding protein [Vicinamibacterales bacterium]|nr:AMP-binding protein [Vicinamibacterales bacterium]
MQLTDLFSLSFEGRRDVVGLEFERADGRVEEFTFGEVDARAERMAAALEARGVKVGDRLLVQLPNSVEFLDIFLACLRLGVIFVPVNVLYKEREVQHIVTDASPALCVVTPESQANLPSGAVAVQVADLADEAQAHRDTPGLRGGDRSGDGDAPAALVYTSGTTGRSKGAVLSHKNFAANAMNLVGAWAMTNIDRYLAVLPLFHVHGLGNGVAGWLACGCRMRLVDRFDASRIVGQFDAFQPTLFFGVPTMYVRLLELDDDVAARIGRSVRLFVCGSAPLPATVLEAFREKFGQTILERYGMSETLMNISNPCAGERRAGTVGQPLPGVSVRIVDHSGVPVGDGTIGELELRGPNVFSGYWNNPAATAAAFRDGWFRTGDLAERSADGYYTMRGRSTDLIISGGFNIYPREIEELLLEQPGVKEVAVVGAPDPRRGEVPIAYIVSDGPLDDAALNQACKRSLASFKMPRGFVQVGSLPRTALGKVQKHLLPPWSSA